MPTTIKLFNFSVRVSTVPDMTRLLVRQLRRKFPSRKSVVPQVLLPISMNDVMSARQMNEVRQAVGSFDFLTMDGMPLVWLARLLGANTAQRVYGPDLMLAVLKATEKLPIKHYFYGSTPEALQQLITTIKTRFPRLQLAGYWSPPFHELSVKEERQMLRRLTVAKPDIIWVGLGSWRQILWAHQYRARVSPKLIMLVGAAFDFVSGTKSQAPVWIRQIGLEWLFRLCQEPTRLWRRYILQIPGFIWLSITEVVGFYGRKLSWRDRS
jgi:N-acetylglucosaminyldiphosphoundecaprenol N-acetyl-beta-D-mannosaminyltransferase